MHFRYISAGWVDNLTTRAQPEPQQKSDLFEMKHIFISAGRIVHGCRDLELALMLDE